MSAVLVIAMAIAALSGIIRGISGFGGAMVMLPPMALVYGPRMAVPVVLLLEIAAALMIAREVAQKAVLRTMAPICLTACATVPIGGYLLATVDQDLMRRAIAAIVMVFSLLLLYGVRYTGPREMRTSFALGAVSGTMLGAAGMGGPPVILYLLSGPDPIVVTRANMALYVVVISVAGLVVLWARGVLDETGAHTALLLTPFYCIGTLVGDRLFRYFSEKRFRQFTLTLMLVVSAGVFVV